METKENGSEMLSQRDFFNARGGGEYRIMKAWNVGGGVSTMQDHICVSPGIFNNDASKVSRILRFQNYFKIASLIRGRLP